MTLKYRVYNQFLQLVNDKIAQKQQILADLRDSAANETKSTAGDKHETALAMLQIEQANNGRQLDELLLQKNALIKIDPTLSTRMVVTGSLIKTNYGYFYLSAALGKITIDEIKVTALSAQSPLGEKLMGLILNDTASVNGRIYQIELIN